MISCPSVNRIFERVNEHFRVSQDDKREQKFQRIDIRLTQNKYWMEKVIYLPFGQWAITNWKILILLTPIDFIGC